MTVYFIGGDFPRVKIGYTDDTTPVNRLMTLQVGSPVTLRVLAHCPGEQSEERRLHKVFRGAHSHGEWFRITKDLASLIGYVSLAGKLEGWEDARSSSVRFGQYVGTFGTADGFREFDGLPRHEIAWKLCARDSYVPRERRPDWAGLVSTFEVVASFEHSEAVVATESERFGSMLEARWVERRSQRISVVTSRPAGLARTAELLAEFAAAPAGLAAIWILACMKDVARQNRYNETASLIRCFPDFALVEQMALGALPRDFPGWSPQMSGVLPFEFEAPKNCVLSAWEFVRLASLNCAATLGRYCVIADWIKGYRGNGRSAA